MLLNASNSSTINTDTIYRSPLRYPGGKQKAVAQIATIFPEAVREYREPMVGGGSVYFYARSYNLAQKYWINDQFEDLVAFWKTAQDRKLCKQLQEELEWLRRSFRTPAEIKKYFLKARQENPKDIYRKALLFFFFNRVTFSGTTHAGGFSCAASMTRFTVSSIRRLDVLPQAMAGVTITDWDFEEVVKEPGVDVFLFLDPPYYTTQRLYGRNGRLHEFDHERLAACLKKTQHRFLITYDDCPEIRQLYRWAKVIPWQLQYGMNNCNKHNLSKIGLELFILNYNF